MPITAIPPNDRREQFIAAGGQTVFPYDFPIYEPGDLAVYRTRAGATTLLTLTTDYTVTGVEQDGGGDVVLASGSLVDDVITIVGDQPIGREDNLADGRGLQAPVWNRNFNRILIGMQQLYNRSQRTLQLSETDPLSGIELPPLAERAGKLVGFNELGEMVPAVGDVGGTVVSPFMATVLDDVSADGALTTLEATTVGKALFRAADALAVRVAIEAAQAKRLLYLTSDTTLTAAHDGFLIMPDATAGNLTITLPLANALGTARPIQLWFFRPDLTGNTVTVQRGGSNVIESGQTSLSLPSGRRFPMLSDAFAVWYTTIDGTPLGRAVLAAADAVAAQSLIGPWVQIANVPITSVAQIDVEWTGGVYQRVEMQIIGARPASPTANNLLVRMRRGGVYLEGASDYGNASVHWLGGTGSNINTQSSVIVISGGGLYNEPLDAELQFGQGAIGERPTMRGFSRWTNNSPAHSIGIYSSNTQAGSGWIDGVRTIFAGGTPNFAATGRIVVMGLKA